MSHASAIRSQIEELEAEVRKDPRVEVIEHLKAALSILEGVETLTVSSPDAKDHPVGIAKSDLEKTRRSFTSPPVGTARSDSKIKRTHDVVARHIDAHGPTHRVQLVQALIAAGLMERVKNPLTGFSTSMHTLREYFVSDGHGTFRRREGAPPEVVPIWTKKHEGAGLLTSSAQAETGARDPGSL